MRLALLIALAACTSGSSGRDWLGVHGPGNGSGSGSGKGGSLECSVDGDCALAGPTCCACPTFAVRASEPAHTACETVACPQSTCPANVRAACDAGACTLECVALTCAMSCAGGYAIDATGCLECACADVGQPACSVDADCTRTRADCCGCQMGGADTAVPISQQPTYDASLGCPEAPQCPGGDSCAAGLSPRCIEGSCELTTATPTGACGRADLPVCPASQQCTLNTDARATMQGLGVCM